MQKLRCQSKPASADGNNSVTPHRHLIVAFIVGSIVDIEIPSPRKYSFDDEPRLGIGVSFPVNA